MQLTDAVTDERTVFLSTLPAGRAQRRLAIAVVLVSCVAFAAAVPFAKVPIGPMWAFIPSYQSALVVNDLVTAVLLFGQFRILQSRGLLLLASGYLFTALIAVSHGLTFPGLFAPAGLLGGGPQTTAWLYMFWHAGLPLLVIGYALLKDDLRTSPPRGRPVKVILSSIAVVFITVLGLTLLATATHGVLPEIMQGHSYTPAMATVVSSVWGLSLFALIALWLRRPRSVLDLWLMVVMCAWLFDIALAAVLNAGRFDLGFYAGRAYGLLASIFVLVVLLLENNVLYARLVDTLESEHQQRERVQEKSAELAELNQSLERRVSERTAELDAINRELRHQMAERERAESEALDSKQRLAGIIDSAMDAIVTIDEEQHVVMFNAAAEALFGCPNAKALGAPLASFIPERFRASRAAHVKRFGETGITSRRMGAERIVMGLRANGEEFPIDASISQIEEKGRKFYTVILRDVTERARAEEALRESQEELHELASIAQEAREQEKRRIARELHDELGQALTGLKMDLAWLKRNPGHQGRLAKMDSMQALLDSTVASTRRIASEMRPLLLDDLGLVPAAEWLVQNFKQRTSIDCRLTVIPPDLDLQDPHATAIFRILQESLTNVARHAQATLVDVTIEQKSDEILLAIRDNGRGFQLKGPRKPMSHGLAGLRERAYFLGGNVSIESAPDKCTTIRTRIPLTRAAVSGSPS